MAEQTWTSLMQAATIALSQSPAPYNTIPADFTNLFANATSYAEDRIFAEMPMLGWRKTDQSLVVTPGTAQLSLAGMSNGQIVTVEGVELVTPAGNTLANGLGHTYDISSEAVIAVAWPNQSLTMSPIAAEWLGRRCAMLDFQTLLIAPTPDQAYTAAITGIFGPTPISEITQHTYLSTFYPELLLSGIMVFLSGALQRNYGAQGDDPKMSTSWEGQFQLLLGPARELERRNRGLAPAVPTKPMPPQAPPASDATALP